MNYVRLNNKQVILVATPTLSAGLVWNLGQQLDHTGLKKGGGSKILVTSLLHYNMLKIMLVGTSDLT